MLLRKVEVIVCDRTEIKIFQKSSNTENTDT